jgi:Rieske [2Fe-2S] domain protein, MocE subfamily
MPQQWIKVCMADEIDEEDVIRFDHGAVSLAVYRSDKDVYYATNGYCTHEKVHLSDGFVMGNIIECPKHNGRFDYTTGQAKKLPACDALKTYPVKVEDDTVYVQLD